MMNRRALVAGGLASIALPGLAVAKKAKPRFRVKLVTKSFHNTDLLWINEAANLPPTPYPSPLKVKGFPRGKIRRVEVSLHGFSHQVPNEVFLLLVSPKGRKTLLLGAVGQGSLVTNLEIVLKDKALTPLPQTQPPPWTSGEYKPTNYGGPQTFASPAPSGPVNSANLAIFNGSNPNGTWKLYVKDADPVNHFGAIDEGWSLRITALVKIRIKRKKN